MKVVLINTLTPGGAYVACKRLSNALQKQGVEISLIEIRATKSNFLWERFCIWIANCFSRKNLFAISIANTGTNISKLNIVREADIIHLHWINQGGLSLHNIKQLQSLGKPIVWTMHDMWPFTGICHHAYDCDEYERQCEHCKQAKSILTNYAFKTKQQFFHHLNFVGCSDWITSLAKMSSLIRNSNICSIPNPIDTGFYKPISKKEAREKLHLELNKRYIIFGAMNTTTSIKGFSFMLEADKHLQTDNIEYLVLGKNSAEVVNQLSHRAHSIGYVRDEYYKKLLYCAADVFVIPSLAENLPNMIMESMACATPCVGFNIGGIPEMIDHKKNGYVAQYKDAFDFAKGIDWVFSSQENLGDLARIKVEDTYKESVVANRYIQFYQSLLNK